MATEKQIHDFDQFVMSKCFNVRRVPLSNPDGYQYIVRQRKLDVTRRTPIEGTAFEKKVCTFLNIDGRDSNSWPPEYRGWYKSRHPSPESVDLTSNRDIVTAGAKRHIFPDGRPHRIIYGANYCVDILHDLRIPNSTTPFLLTHAQSRKVPKPTTHGGVACRQIEKRTPTQTPMGAVPPLCVRALSEQRPAPNQGFMKSPRKDVPYLLAPSTLPGMGEQPDIHIDMPSCSSGLPSHEHGNKPSLSSFRAASNILLRYKECNTVQQSAFIWQYFPPRGCPDLHNPEAPQQVLAELIEASATNGMRATKIQVIAAMEIFVKAGPKARRDQPTLYHRMARALESVAP